MTHAELLRKHATDATNEGGIWFSGEYMDRLAKVAESLEAENAKLRNEVDNLLDFEHLTSVAVAYAGCDECGEYKQTMLRLFAENAKLRELVTAQCECVKHDDCGECVHYSEGQCTFPFKVMHRELGVEVESV